MGDWEVSSSDTGTRGVLSNHKLPSAIPFGEPGSEKVLLNVDSLWSGGPFEAEVSSVPCAYLHPTCPNADAAPQNYTGGNPADAIYSALPEIRDTIFQDGTGSKTLWQRPY